MRFVTITSPLPCCAVSRKLLVWLFNLLNRGVKSTAITHFSYDVGLRRLRFSDESKRRSALCCYPQATIRIAEIISNLKVIRLPFVVVFLVKKKTLYILASRVSRSSAWWKSAHAESRSPRKVAIFRTFHVHYSVLFRGIFLTIWYQRVFALILLLMFDLYGVVWPSFNHQDCPYLTQLPYGLFRTPWTCADVTSVNKDGPREAQPNVPSKTKVAGVERCHTLNNSFI